MSKFAKKSFGAVSGYLIGVVLLALVLVGGVLILKNNQPKTASNSAPTVSVNTPATVKNSDTEKSAENADNSENSTPAKTADNGDDSAKNSADNSASATIPADDSANENANLTATGATGVATPTTVAETGPSDTFAAIFGAALIFAAGYMGWRYWQSRVAVERELLRK